MPLAKVADWYYKAELEALVAETDLTNVQIAAELGVSTRTITNWITGETRPKAGMAAMLAQICGASEKRIQFLTHVINQLDKGTVVSDLEKRNIFIVERAEATYGEFWKFESCYIPGPLQDERYHMEGLPGHGDQPMTHWQRKLRRKLTLRRRRPRPAMRYLIGAQAIRHLARWEWGPDFFETLVEEANQQNCEIRILDGIYRGAEHSFEVYLPAGRQQAGPRFVYVETFDQSRHIEDDIKFGLYHNQVKELWSYGSPIGRSLNDWVH
ncbi:helix-turn-helix domain-containing protein [Glycomyces artemisiae]|uniref:Helix-turn-helix protein n=1 Tax=Glycomyces artemisiae TaxID=1076443 RepID=A0A2T0UJ81_9ACTN|nr:helix-turn-helix transcriptional regulator [Glycomyces artemisiae]PRY57926.1 helix-turn-helix protein [Glycomyces artemisiae]